MSLTGGAVTTARRVLSSLRTAPASPSRSIHASASAKGGAGHGDGHGYDDYIHAPHMYNLKAMKNRKMKMGIAMTTLVVSGFGIPIYAVMFQMYPCQSHVLHSAHIVWDFKIANRKAFMVDDDQCILYNSSVTRSDVGLAGLLGGCISRVIVAVLTMSRSILKALL